MFLWHLMNACTVYQIKDVKIIKWNGKWCLHVGYYEDDANNALCEQAYLFSDVQITNKSAPQMPFWMIPFPSDKNRFCFFVWMILCLLLSCSHHLNRPNGNAYFCCQILTNISGFMHECGSHLSNGLWISALLSVRHGD